MKRTFLLTILSGAALFAQTTQEKLAADQAKLAAAQARIAGEQAKTQALQSQISLREGSFGAQTVQFVSGLVGGPLVTGAPYSAEAVIETTQTLGDGNRIEQRTSSKQYRDGVGRERREESSNMNAVFITDPVAKVSLTLHPDTKTAERSSIGSNFVFATKGEPGSGAKSATPIALRRETYTGGTTQTLETTSVVRTEADAVHVPLTTAPSQFGYVTAKSVMFVNSTPGTAEPKFEDLGTRSIEGVQAAGKRSTMIIPAGQIGNVRPIEIVDENWYSPELQMTIMTRHSDPRAGETIFKLTNVQRIEPVRQLFELPTDYTLVEDRMNGANKTAAILRAYEEQKQREQDLKKALGAAGIGAKE